MVLILAAATGDSNGRVSAANCDGFLLRMGTILGTVSWACLGLPIGLLAKPRMTYAVGTESEI